MPDPQTTHGNEFDGHGAGWVLKEEITQIWRFLNGTRSEDEATLSITPDGHGLSFKAHVSTVPVRITAGGEPGALSSSSSSSPSSESQAFTQYTVSVYANGSNNAATATDQALVIIQLASGEAVPNGTWLLASQIGSTYYGQVPVWL